MPRQASPSGIGVFPLLMIALTLVVVAYVSVTAAVVLLAIAVLLWLADRNRRPARSQAQEDPVQLRLDRLEARMSALEFELRVRRGGVAPASPEAAPEPVEAPKRAAAAATLRVRREPAAPAQPQRRAFDWARELDLSVLMGARGLAVAGGVVTLLGIVFFFVLAANRGWIGPGLRIAFGGAASAAVFGAGLWLRRRFGPTYSSLAASGVGIAGGYTTLLAAGALYDFVPDWAGLLIASGIAGLGVATALRWSSQLVAAFGLIGAMLVPVPIALDSGITALGTGFVALVLAASVVVAVAQTWNRLLAVAALASAPQASALAIHEGSDARARVIVLAAVFTLLYAAASIARHVRVGRVPLEPLTASLALLGAVFGCGAAAILFDGAYGRVSREGLALLSIALVYGAAGVVLYPRRSTRDPGALFVAIALAVGAVAFSDLLSQATLASAWAAEAAVLAWLSRRIREPRLQLAALAYLLLALGHAVILDSPPSDLYVAGRHPAEGATAVAALMAASGVFGFYARTWLARDLPKAVGIFRPLVPLYQAQREAQPLLRSGAFWLTGLAATYAASLGVLELFEELGTHVGRSFAWGHVAVSGLWAAAGLVALVAGAARNARQVEIGAFGWLGLVLANVWIYDVGVLEGSPRWVSSAVVSGIVLAAGIAREVIRDEPVLHPAAAGLVAASALLAGSGAAALIGPERGEGAVLLAIGGGYVLLAALLFPRQRQRDLTTELWIIGFALAAVALAELLDGTYLVLAWASLAAVLAWVASATRERRLTLAALAFLAIGLVHTLLWEAQPSDLFVARSHPGAGVPALAAWLAAALVVMRFLPPVPRARLSGSVVLAVLAVFGCSLGILEVFQRVGHGDVSTVFQRGHTAVSTFWGLIGAGLLYAGLTRARQSLRIGGFALFGVSLAKIFLYDLPNLSSITRALSFLGVGALLLIAGFFYQRLSAEYDERQARRPVG